MTDVVEIQQLLVHAVSSTVIDGGPFSWERVRLLAQLGWLHSVREIQKMCEEEDCVTDRLHTIRARVGLLSGEEGVVDQTEEVVNDPVMEWERKIMLQEILNERWVERFGHDERVDDGEYERYLCSEAEVREKDEGWEEVEGSVLGQDVLDMLFHGDGVLLGKEWKEIEGVLEKMLGRVVEGCAQVAGRKLRLREVNRGLRQVSLTEEECMFLGVSDPKMCFSLLQTVSPLKKEEIEKVVESVAGVVAQGLIQRVSGLVLERVGAVFPLLVSSGQREDVTKVFANTNTSGGVRGEKDAVVGGVGWKDGVGVVQKKRGKSDGKGSRKREIRGKEKSMGGGLKGGIAGRAGGGKTQRSVGGGSVQFPYRFSHLLGAGEKKPVSRECE